MQPPSRLGRFWSWWTTELSHVFGVKARQDPMPRRQVRIEDGEAIVTDARGRERSRKVLSPDTGSAIAPGKPLALILPAESVILRKRTLPRRAEAELSRVVDLQFDAHIPLRRDQCYAAFDIVGRNGDTLDVLIAAVPRDTVDEARRRLSEVGLSPNWIGLADHRLNVLTDGCAPSRRLRNLIASVLGLLAVALLAVAIWVPVLRLQEHNDALELRAQTAMARANAALQQRQGADELQNRIAMLDAFAAPVELLFRIDALAGGMADDSNVVSMSFDGSQLALTVETPDPAKLMQDIAALDGIGVPELTSPISRQQDGRARIALAVPLEGAE